MQEKKTETEQLYDDMTGEADEQAEPEQDEEVDEHIEEEQEQEEELLSEEELEIEREIAEYASKIEKLDAKLAEHKAQHVEALKREQMEKAHYTDEQILRYIDFIEGETKDEILNSLYKLIEDIPAAGKDPCGDPSLMNHAKQRYTVDHESVGRELGKKAFERVKNKIHGLRWW